jgi:hypothetical protein
VNKQDDASSCGGRLHNSKTMTALYHAQIQHNKVETAVFNYAAENNITPPPPTHTHTQNLGMFLIWSLRHTAHIASYKHSLSLYKHNGKIWLEG